MKKTDFCGIDFGTSNSTIGVFKDLKPFLVPVENENKIIPTAIFFSFEENETFYGNKAIEEYVDGAEGRLLRAIKSVLGSSLAYDKTNIRGERIPFTDILGMFIGHLKKKAEEQIGQNLEKAILGRPVFFVDNNPEADRSAQSQLEKAAFSQGFKEVSFQYEPLAAAFDYEATVQKEELAFIVDIGGGTSDFSIVRVAPERREKSDRKEDILANEGVHIGGTDFDRLLSLSEIMPCLGYKTFYKNKRLNLPSSIYFDLATWQRINLLYKKEVFPELKHIAYEAENQKDVEKFINIVKNRKGHFLAGLVEKSKIELTHAAKTSLSLPLKGGEVVEISREMFDMSVERSVREIEVKVQKTLHMAGVQSSQIDVVFLTGGSTKIPVVKQMITDNFPAAQIVEGEAFGSVGTGLVWDAQRKFG